MGDAPLPRKFALRDLPPFKNNDFDQYPLRSDLAKNVQLVLIGSRPLAFQRAIEEPCALPLSPQRVAQNAILLFLSVKFNFCRKRSATNFCVCKFLNSVVLSFFCLQQTGNIMRSVIDYEIRLRFLNFIIDRLWYRYAMKHNRRLLYCTKSTCACEFQLELTLLSRICSCHKCSV